MRMPELSILPLLERAGYGGAICARDGTIIARNQLADDVFASVAPPGRNGGPEPRLPYRLLQVLQTNPMTPVFLNTGRDRCVVAQRFAGCADGNESSILVLADLNHCGAPHIGTLQRAFGLTPCEARLAAALAAGLRLEDIARMHHVEIGTVRGQLKSVFIKTATKRQPELVALLARLPLFF